MNPDLGRRRPPALTRRVVLGAASTVPFLFAGAARGAVPQRIVALDYVLAEQLVVLGAPPVAVTDTTEWDKWVLEPPLPPGTVDIGTGLAPNVELIAALRPDLIMITDFTAISEAQLRRAGPVERFSIHSPGGSPLPKAAAALRRMGVLTGREAEAERYLAETEREFASLAERARPFRDKPVLMLAFLDPRHARIYARPGMQQDVLDRLGLRNAWTHEGNFWGFDTAGIERLAEVGEARAIADYLPPDVRVVLDRSPLWRELPFRRGHGALPVLPPVSTFGGVPAARRLARLLVEAFERGDA